MKARVGSRLLVLAGGNFVMGVDTFVIAPILRPMSSDLGVSRSAANWLLTDFAITYALAGLLLGAAVGHLPPRRLLIGGLAVFAVGNAAGAPTDWFAVALAARVVATGGAWLYSANALTTARALVPPERQARAAATVVGGLTSALVVGVPLGAWVGGTTGWRTPLVGLAVLAVLAAVLNRGLLPPVPGRPRESLRSRLRPLAEPSVRIVLAATALCLTTSWTVYDYVDVVLHPATDGSVRRLSVVLLAFGARAVVGNLCIGRLTDRVGPVRVVTVAAPALGLVAAGVPLAAATYGTALAAATLWGFLHWTVNVPQQLRAVAAAPAAAPLVLGLHQSTIYVGITLGTIIGFAGNDLAGRAGIAGCTLVVGALAVTVIRLSVRPSAEPPPADESPDPEPSLARP